MLTALLAFAAVAGWLSFMFMLFIAREALKEAEELLDDLKRERERLR